MSCPGAETFAAWAAGRVGGAERDRLEDHCAGCRLCRGVMLALAGVAATVKPRALATLGRYEIRATLRDGGLRGWDPELGREVTIAVATVPDPEERETILADADKVAKLTHRNLARVYDSGSIGDTVYVAMQVVEGESWNDWLLQRPRRSRRRRVVREVGNALNALHLRGVIHRDICPSNVTIRPDGSAVLHLGLGQSPAVANELTTGARPSARSDQFAWWMLATTALGTGFPYRRAFKKGLAKNPRLRFPSMDAAVGALATPWWLYVGGVISGLFALGVFVGLATDDNPRHHGWTDSTACHVTTGDDWRAIRAPVATRLGMVTPAHASRILTAIDDRAEATRQRQIGACAAGEAKRAERSCLTAFWSQTMGEVQGLLQTDPRSVHRAIDRIAVVTPPDACLVRPIISLAPALEGAAAGLDGQITRVMTSPGNADARATQLEALVEKVAAINNASLSYRLHHAMASQYFALGDRDRAVREAKLAVASAEDAGDDRYRALELIELVKYTDHIDAGVEASAEDAVAKLHSHGLTARLTAEEGYAREHQQRWNAAVTKLEQARSEYELVAIDTHADQVSIEWFLANAYAGTGAYERADLEFARALAAAGERYGEGSLEQTNIRGELANNLLSLNKPDRAREEFSIAAKRLATLLGSKREEVARSYGGLCEADISVGSPSSSCDQALSFAQQCFGPDTSATIWYLDLVGRMDLLRHDDDAAINTLEHALSIATRDHDGSTDLPVTQALLAIALHRQEPSSPRAAKLARTARTSLAPIAEARSVLADLDTEFK